MALQMYLVDAFVIYAASAVAANTVVRSIAGAVLPLCGLSKIPPRFAPARTIADASPLAEMYEVLGVGWGNSLLGFIALAMVPLPFLIQRYGEYLRTKFEVKNL
jgi:hypothetical protein